MTKPVRVTWAQALAWRMERHLLDPVGTLPVAAVVRRLCGVQSQVASSAELAIRVRRRRSRPGDVARALAAGTVIKTWAMRGALHVLTPEDAGAFLSLLAASRSWETPAWQKWFGVGPAEIEELRVATREALDGMALTREELGAAVTRRRRLAHLGEAVAEKWGSLWKPLAWQGDLCIGPSQGNRVTFMRPDQASPRWAGVPEPEEAAPRAVLAYLAAYGPAGPEGFGKFVSRGVVSKKSLRAWFGLVADRVAEVDVEGDLLFVRAEDLDSLVASRPTRALRLLPGFDQWILGPGTDDPRVLDQRRRSAVSRQAGWISPLVVHGGVVAGTWQREGDVVRIGWFGERGKPPRRAIAAEVERLGEIIGRPLAGATTSA
jgi:hypothetical protein